MQRMQSCKEGFCKSRQSYAWRCLRKLRRTVQSAVWAEGWSPGLMQRMLWENQKRRLILVLSPPVKAAIFIFHFINNLGVDNFALLWYYIRADTERYRSGHNEAVLKTVWRKPHGFESHPLRHTCGGQFACRSFFIYISLDNFIFTAKIHLRFAIFILRFIHRQWIKQCNKIKKQKARPSGYTAQAELF